MVTGYGSDVFLVELSRRSTFGRYPPYGGNHVPQFIGDFAGRFGYGIEFSGGTAAFVRRQLSPEEGRAIEILGHAIEYLADEYCADAQPKGRLGNADPRIEAIQTLKSAESVDLLFLGGSGTGIHAHEAVGDGYADALNPTF